MARTAKYAQRWSTFSLIAAVATFLFWRVLNSYSPIIKVDPHNCFQESDGGLVFAFAGGILWFTATVMSFGGIFLGLAARQFLSSLKCVIALGIAFLNFSNLPSADIMLIPEIFPVATLRSVSTAQITYLSASGGSYGTISDLVRNDLLDSRFEQQSIRNYTFQSVPGPKDYVVTATPTNPDYEAQGCWEYYATGDAVIRFSKNPRKAPPGLAGKPLSAATAIPASGAH
jgi:hypothetical protein